MGMALRRSSRRFGLVIGALVVLVPLALQPLPAAASSTGTLFGVTGNQDILVRVDPITGTMTQLTDLRVPGSDAQSASMASDPISHRLFLVRTTVTFVFPSSITITEELLTIDSRSGAILSHPVLSGRGLQNLAFDTSSGTLFGYTGVNIVRVNPTTGAQSLVAPIDNPTFAVVSLAIAPALHILYVSLDSEDFDIGGFTTQILSVDTATGAVTPGPTLTRSVRSIAFDTSNRIMVGPSDCCPEDVIQVDPSTGATNFLASLGDVEQLYWTAIDPGSHALFVDASTFDPNTGTSQAQLATIDDTTGALVLSPPMTQVVESMAFETVVVVTAESLRNDVVQARASGAIDSAGVYKTLLDDLDGAAAATARGQCKTANNAYQKFINDLTSQSGKHVARDTAGLLADEALALIVKCA